LILGAAGLVTTLAGALGAPRLAARSQRDLNRLEERRAVLDAAAISLSESEASARAAWRALLELEVHSDEHLDDILKDPRAGLEFPRAQSSAADLPVALFSESVNQLRAISARLLVRFPDSEPAIQAFSSASNRLTSVATVMGFAAKGIIAPGGDDLESTVDEFLDAIRAQADFLIAARRLVS
jgi:hypothetical protein